MIDIPCSSCGACCRRIGALIATAKESIVSGYVAEGFECLYNEIVAFPYAVLPNGQCEKLQDDGRCGVYDTRPDICRYDKSYVAHFTKLMSEEQFLEHTKKVCNTYIEEDGLDHKYILQ